MAIRIGQQIVEEKPKQDQQVNGSGNTGSSNVQNTTTNNTSSNYVSNPNEPVSVWDNNNEEEKAVTVDQKTGKAQEEDYSKNADSYKTESYYQDQMQKSAHDAIASLRSSSIFQGQGVDQYFDRMVNAVDCIINNQDWKVNMDADGDGTLEDVNLADAVASSFDSELDLYIMEQVNEVMKKYGTCSKTYLGEKAIAELAEKGIVVESIGSSDDITNRVYTFSLVDEDGNVLTDKNGKKGSYIFADCLIPDGCAQGAEINLSSILDQMGYDCISKADFIGREDEYDDMLAKVQDNIDAGLYNGNGGTDTLYGNRKDILQSVKDLWNGSGPAPGMWGIGGGSGHGDLTPEELKELQEKEAIEAKKDGDKSDYRKELLDKAIQEYKDNHEGEKPTGTKLDIIEADVELKVNSKYGY